MRSYRPCTVTVTNSPEVELEWEASVTPGDPGCRTLRNGDPGWPPTGPEVDDVHFVLGPAQLVSARKLLGAFFASGKTEDSCVEGLVQDILTDVLDARNIQPDDDEFRDAANEEPDADDQSNFE